MKKESKRGKPKAVPEEKVVRTERPEASPSLANDYGVVKVEEDVEKNRIRLFFAAKPDDAALTFLKECGFRWSPQNRSWYSVLNNKSRFVVGTILNKVVRKE